MNPMSSSLITRPGRLLAGLVVLATLAACGYKGPLYMPPPPPPPDESLTQPPTTAPATPADAAPAGERPASRP